MKRFVNIFSFVLLFFGCQSDRALSNEGETVISVSLPSTRTSLGVKEGDNYPVYWSEGDKIVVNGIESSEAAIDAGDSSKATFAIGDNIEHPYYITYPYCNATTAEQPIVLFPAEQTYVEGSFSQGSAPMCGYVAGASDAVSLRHLAAVLRLPVKAHAEGTFLQKIVIKSLHGVKLAGEFLVDCQGAAISPTSNTGSSVTYTLPADFTLSTIEESLFHITLPSGELDECVVEFVESADRKMTAYWSADKVKAGVVREFKTITYKAGTSLALTALGSEDDALDIYPNPSVRGYVRDTAGNGIEGVSVSDGFTVVRTNAEGYYALHASSDAWYIYISIPAEFEIPRGEYGLPCFYQRYDVAKKRYDFELKPLAGGKENKFALFTLADIHITSKAKADYFKNRVISHVNKQYDAYAQQGIPAYGVNLGDNITNYSSANTSAWRDDILPGLALSKTPMFSVFGNHDCIFFNSDNKLDTDEHSSTFNIKVQREFEEMFGPVNYSFDRGDAHIVCMRNILYAEDQSGNISRGFSAEQYHWLKQDLANVPKDKMALLCVHHQMHLYRGNSITGAEISGTNANGTKGYYKFNFGENVILANVYNADSKWNIAVYEDGEYSGKMELASGLKPNYSTLIGDGSYDNPFRFAEGVESGMDLYIPGFHLGLKGRKTSHSGAWQQCTHMYKYELKNKDAKVKVVVTDRWGKVYEEENFVDGTVYTFSEL